MSQPAGHLSLGRNPGGRAAFEEGAGRRRAGEAQAGLREAGPREELNWGRRLGKGGRRPPRPGRERGAQEARAPPPGRSLRGAREGGAGRLRSSRLPDAAPPAACTPVPGTTTLPRAKWGCRRRESRGPQPPQVAPCAWDSVRASLAQPLDSSSRPGRGSGHTGGGDAAHARARGRGNGAVERGALLPEPETIRSGDWPQFHFTRISFS